MASDPRNDEPGDETRREVFAPSAPLELVVPTDDGVRLVRLHAGRSYVLGRAANADVLITAAAVSRQHVELRVGRDAALEARDLGSANGSKAGGAPLGAEWRPVTPPSVLELGSLCVLVQRSVRGAPAAAPTPAEGGERILADPAMLELDRMIGRVADASLNVLILGETGVGKEGLAAEIHARSSRRAKPFLRLNCAALAESILDGELFGYERGAFTGAITAKAGLFESAEGGTVFLDEVGELPLPTQAKLLRVLESGEVLRLGSRAPKRVTFGCVAATNVNLQQAVRAGRFRGDLYFRLTGMTLRVPPLRERPTEILPLARAFVARAAAVMRTSDAELSPEAAAKLTSYTWPGNVRELKNTVERALVLAQGRRIGAEDIVLEPADLMGGPSLARAAEDPTTEVLRTLPPATSAGNQEVERTLTESLRAIERDRIVGALARAGGNQRTAARELGVSRYTLMKRMEAFGVPRPKKRT